MPKELRIKCSLSLENLSEITGQVLSAAKDCGLAKKRLGDLELALEESLVNIINYANTQNNNAVEIVVGIDDDSRFVVQIIDNGDEFNPLNAPDPDLTVDIADRPIGGLGIYLVKNIMDDIKYRRENDQNILELIMIRDT